MSNQLALRQGIIDMFGKPLIKCIPETDVYENWVKQSKFDKGLPPYRLINDMRVISEINSKYPVHVHFCPNGNYRTKVGTKDRKWGGRLKPKTEEGAEHAEGIIKDSSPGEGPSFNGMIIDCDLKTTTHKDLGTYFDTDLSWRLESIEPTALVAQPGGFHLYYVFDEKDRDKINKKYSVKELESIIKYMHNQFPGGDTELSRCSLSAFIRLPETNYRKTGTPIRTHIVKYTSGMKYKDIKGNIIIDPDVFKTLPRLSLSSLNNIYNVMMSDINFQKVEEKKMVKRYGNDKYTEIRDIPMGHIIEKLHDFDYKRAWSIRDSSNKIINIIAKMELVNDSFIWLREEGTNTLYPTSGYKLEKDNNFINNFSATDIKRPVGSGFQFLEYYFNNKLHRVEEFLYSKFGLTIQKVKIADGETVLKEYKNENNTFTVRMTNRKTSISHIVSSPSGKELTRDTNIFEIPFEIVARTKTTISAEYGYLEIPENVYVIKNFEGKSVSVYPGSNSSKFNAKYMTQIGHFYGNDNELGMFFHALAYMEDIPEKELRYFGGFYKDSVYFLGNQVSQLGKKENLIEEFFTKGKLNSKPQISVKDMTKKVAELWGDEVAICAVLGAIMCAGMNIRKEQAGNLINISPALYITGRTKTGKSTLADVIRSIIGFDDVSTGSRDKRDRTSSFKTITAKALQESATPAEPIFYEEITGDNLKKGHIETLRNIVNGEMGARGTPGKTIHYQFKSPIVCLGENLTTEESVNNRMCIIALHERNKIIYKDANGNIDISKLNDITNYTCWQEVYSELHKAYLTDGRIEKAVKEAQEKLFIAKIDSRNNDKWARILACNSLFDIGYSDNDVIKAIKYRLNKSGESNSSFIESNNPVLELKGILMEQVMKRSCIVRRIDSNYGGRTVGTIYEVMFLGDFINKNKAKLANIVQEIEDITGTCSMKIIVSCNMIVGKIEDSIPETLILHNIFNTAFKLLGKGNVDYSEGSISELRDSY